MNVKAAMVKELREQTGSGMMECKRALVEADGNMELAIEQMRKAGLAKADKKANRIAAEGAVFIKSGGDGKFAAIIEINCETDFVTKGDDFLAFADAVVNVAVESDADSIESFMQSRLDDEGTIEQARLRLIARIGENINVRRMQRIANQNSAIGHYLHGSRIGVLVETEGGDNALRRDIAMHIAASKPECVAECDVSEEVLKRERDIFAAQAKESGKPDNIVEKMVAGRLKKFLGEITLVGQPFIKDPDVSIASLLKNKNATVLRFVRYEVGEGIEKKDENFAEEVMAQVRGD